MRIEFPSFISFKTSINVLIIYFLLFVPLWKFLFASSSPWSNYYFEVFSLITFVWLIYSKKMILSREFDSKRVLFRNFFIGLGLGCFLFISLISLSYLFTLMGVDDKNFLVEKPIYPIEKGYSSLVHLVKILAFSFIIQIVFLGVLVQPLTQRFNLILVVYLSAILFPLLNLKLVLSYFSMGLICSLLFCLTGSVIPAIFFQLFSSLTKVLLLDYFPELIPLLTFLF